MFLRIIKGHSVEGEIVLDEVPITEDFEPEDGAYGLIELVGLEEAERIGDCLLQCAAQGLSIECGQYRGELISDELFDTL